MKSLVLAFTLLCGVCFSQTETPKPSPFSDCALLVEPSPFATPAAIETAITNLSTLSKVRFCSDYHPDNITYKPVVYDWTQAAQRIDDYKFAQYAYRRQDVNGRDLMLDVITNEMINTLLQRALPR